MRCGRSAVAGVLMVVMGLALVGCGRVGGEPFQPTLNRAVPLDADRRVVQTVNPADEEVSGIAVQVATFAADPDPSGTLSVSLRDPADGRLLGSAEVAGDELADATWVHAGFEPPVEVDDVVSVEVAWQGDTPLAVWANTPQPGTEGIVNDPYPAGELVVDGQPVPGDLAFRVTSPATPGEALGQVGEIARSTAARLTDQPVFTIMWVLALIGSLGLAVTGLRRRA